MLHINQPIHSLTNFTHRVWVKGMVLSVGALLSSSAFAIDPAGIQSNLGVLNTPPTVAITSPVNQAIVSAPKVTINATASDPDGSIAKVEFYRGTTKLGEDLTAPYSFVWTTATAGVYSINVVATDNQGATNNYVNNITVIGGGVVNGNALPGALITSPRGGTTFYDTDSIPLAAVALDNDGTISKVEFFDGPTKIAEDVTYPYFLFKKGFTAGSHTLTAVATDNLGAKGTSTAVPFTVIQNSLPTVTITSPVNRAIVSAPNVTINATASDSDGSITKVEFYKGSTKLGEDLTAPYSFIWTTATAGSYQISVVATDNRGGNINYVNNITVIGGGIVNGNALPGALITSPRGGATFNSTDSIPFSATALDNDGTITNVEFFDGSVKIGEDATYPYFFFKSGFTAGSHTLTVVATDNLGAKGTSAPITFGVVQNSLPTVAITSPVNQAIVSAPNVTINATASDTDGNITKVEFYKGTTKLGEDLTAPYSFTWTTATAGAYQISIVATDNLNATSNYVNNITVIGGGIVNGNALPGALLVFPRGGGSFLSTDSIPLSATALDNDGTISKVEFFNGTTKIGEDLSYPYLIYWKNAPVGPASLTAVAIDNLGAKGTSDPANITVLNPVSPNLALNKTATASSVENGGTSASKAVDGNSSTRWSSAFSDPQWIVVDLGASYAVNRVKINWEAAYGKNYKVQISTNNSQWNDLKTVTNNTTLVNDWTGLSGTGRYIRVLGSARGTGYGYSIYELEVYGSAAAREGIEEISAITDLVLSPNPATDYINVVYNNAATTSVAFQITSINGNLVQSGTLAEGINGTINISSLASGVYVAQFHVNGSLIVKRFVK